MTPIALVILMLLPTAPVLDASRIAHHIDALSKPPHHLAGSPQGRAAGDVILSVLHDSGFTDDDILVQPFEVTQLQQADGDCYMEVAGQRHPMQPLRPNGLALSVTPAEGIDAQTVYLRAGTWKNFAQIQLKGKIAVLDWDCGDQWRRAFARGAVAVIFIGPEEAHQSGRKWTLNHAPLPRFCVTSEIAAAAGLYESRRVRLFSKLQFKRSEARNIFVVIPGTDAAQSAKATAIATSYDSFGVLPFQSLSKRRIANVAALLETARHLRQNPQPLTTAVMFFDGDAQGGLGQLMFQFARARWTGKDDGFSFTWMIGQRQIEHQYIEAKLAALEDVDAVIEGRDTSDVSHAEREDLLNHFELLYNNMRDQRMQLLLDLTRSKEADDDKTINELTPKIDTINQQREAMATLRRAAMAAKITDEVRPLLDQLITERRKQLRLRLDEIATEIRHFESHRAIGETFNQKQLLAVMMADVAPTDAAWTLALPSASPQTLQLWSRKTGQWGGSSARPQFVPNAMLTHWLDQSLPQWITSGRVRHLVMTPPSSYQSRTGAWQTMAVAHLALVANSIGTPWPDRGSPQEPDANVSALATRFGEVVDVFQAMSQRPELNRMRLPAPAAIGAFEVPQWIESQHRYRGNYARRYGGGSVEAEQSLSNAVVSIAPGYALSAPNESDMTGGYLTTATVHGTFTAMGSFVFPNSAPDLADLSAAAYDAQGNITAISQYRPSKGLATVGSWESPGYFFLRRENRLSVFDAVATCFSQPMQPLPRAAGGGNVSLLQGLNNVALGKLNLTYDNDLAAVWLDRNRPVKLIHDGMLMLGNSTDDPTGEGVRAEALAIDVPSRAATDTWTLNESRLNNLRRYGIIHNELERHHAEAQDWLEAARDIESTSPDIASAYRNLSLGHSSAIYQPVRDVTNDLVKAVVILLLLAIPFSFAFERLVFGSPNIYRQISAFMGTFLIVFAILYFVHPAFRIATFPVVVLLAFVIIIMSSIVIYIMWARFEHEIKHMQGVATASHRSTRSGRGTIGAAIGLGISTMRRRPLRTALTATTIILLTFTILFFGAFNSEGASRRIYLGPSTGQRCVEVGLTGARRLNTTMVDTLINSYRNTADAYVRNWQVLAGGTQTIARTTTDQLIPIDGWSQLHPHDLGQYPTLRSALTGDVDAFERAGGVWLPEPLAAKMNLAIGTTIHLEGRDYLYRGSFNPDAIAQVRTVHGVAFIPADIEQMRQLIAQQYPNDSLTQSQKLLEMDLAEFPLVDASRVVLLWDSRATPQKSATTLVFTPQSDRAAYSIAEELASLLGSPVTVRAGGQIDRIVYVTKVSLSGLSSLIVPLLLGGLIIFSTMLSSVSDREREIFTFSAVGLAPIHVAVLFFAEAAVYAVLGGMGGYLLSQGFGKGVETVAHFGWITAPSMNYSSLNAMAAIVIVMATVLVSTIYPAYKASRSANPAVQRRWKLTPPDGDRHEVKFPFTVSAYDLVGLISFLEEYFLSNADKSVGAFAADNIVLTHHGHTFELSATVWLPPFDQGVNQSFRLRAEPSDIEGIDEIYITMHRQSGSPVIWQRSNRLFVDDIRKQFIFWRTIGEETQEHYHTITTTRFELNDEVG